MMPFKRLKVICLCLDVSLAEPKQRLLVESTQTEGCMAERLCASEEREQPASSAGRDGWSVKTKLYIEYMIEVMHHQTCFVIFNPFGMVPKEQWLVF
jgi:hypothetical protein